MLTAISQHSKTMVQLVLLEVNVFQAIVTLMQIMIDMHHQAVQKLVAPIHRLPGRIVMTVMPMQNPNKPATLGAREEMVVLITIVTVLRIMTRRYGAILRLIWIYLGIRLALSKVGVRVLIMIVLAHAVSRRVN